MMIDSILSDPVLSPFTRGTCEENGICVNFCNELLSDQEINDSLVCIISVDSYYNSLGLKHPPPSIDCLIVIDNNNETYDLHLVELKSINNAAHIRSMRDNIKNKFLTTVLGFMEKDFENIFSDKTYANIKSWLIAPYCKKHNQPEKRQIQGSCLDYFMLLKPMKFAGKVFQIEPAEPGLEICN